MASVNLWPAYLWLWPIHCFGLSMALAYQLLQPVYSLAYLWLRYIYGFGLYITAAYLWLQHIDGFGVWIWPI